MKLVTEDSKPVGSGRFRDLPKTREESWVDLFALPLLSILSETWLGAFLIRLVPCFQSAAPS
jgi:hypothetical protein